MRNPAFDVTPAELVTGIITERGIVLKPNRARVARSSVAVGLGRRGPRDRLMEPPSSRSCSKSNSTRDTTAVSGKPENTR